MKLRKLLEKQIRIGRPTKKEGNPYNDPPSGYVFAIRPRKGMAVYRWEKGKVGQKGVVVRVTEKNEPLIDFGDGKKIIVQTYKLLRKSNIKEDTLIEYIQHIEGHKNSKGEDAPWVIKDHETHEVISSHKTKKKAKEHLQQMKIHG